MNEFIEFPKIPRYSRDCIITEKIDGTNGQIFIPPLQEYEPGLVMVGSRSRWITPENDNHGFAKWAYAHTAELFRLGPGVHFGEWWGQGINRGYGLKEKRFSLFNVTRWDAVMFERFKVESWKNNNCQGPKPEFKAPPTCCLVVPVIAVGTFGCGDIVNLALSCLEGSGSYAAPGFMKPEGIVIYHTAGNCLFKKTVKHDEEPKGAQNKSYREQRKRSEDAILRG